METVAQQRSNRANAESQASIDAQQQQAEPAQLSATERYILAMLARDFRIAEGEKAANDQPEKAGETSAFQSEAAE
jgi:hypothetical protein